MMGLAKEAPRRQDRRSVWDNSPELRESVRDDLYEWGGAQRGGMPRLGYPSEQPFSITPSKMPPTYDADKVQAITDTFVMWNLIQNQCGDEQTRETLKRLQKAIKNHFVGQKPAESSASSMRISRTHFYRILGEAMYRFWVLHY